MTNLKTENDLSKLSKNETLKANSQGLLGQIPDEIESSTAAFTEDAVQLLKHHGTYQQDNRDLRSERRKAGLDKAWSMMLRTRTPGGEMSADQYVLCDDLATKYGQNDLRITSRQGFQFHGVLKGNLRALIHDLNHLQKISTQGACGDVVRNVTCCSVVDIDPKFAHIKDNLLDLARRISAHFLAKSSSYYDLWLNDERVTVDPDGSVHFKEKAPSKPVEEPIYGTQYLPRKFKIGVAVDFDNSIDVFTNDAAVIAATENGRIVGFEVIAGGGLGHNHSKKETYARLATPVTFVQTQDDAVLAIEAIVKAQRDYGNRAERQQARLKYTIDGMGREAFKKLVDEYAGKTLPEPRNIKVSDQPDYLGWSKQIQPGLNYVGVWIENGRVRDFEGTWQFKTGLRKIVERFRPSVRLTAHHNLILANIKDADVAAVQALLDEYKIPTKVSNLRRLEMACPALPLCGLALSEAERELPRVLDAVAGLGHADDDVIIRMTGCPNSCARPETAEIGIIGRGPGKYNLYTGADRQGMRMNSLVAESVTGETLAPKIARLLTEWKAGRSKGESFGDWAHRQGVDAIKALVA